MSSFCYLWLKLINCLIELVACREKDKKWNYVNYWKTISKPDKLQVMLRDSFSENVSQRGNIILLVILLSILLLTIIVLLTARLLLFLDGDRSLKEWESQSLWVARWIYFRKEPVETVFFYSAKLLQILIRFFLLFNSIFHSNFYFYLFFLDFILLFFVQRAIELVHSSTLVAQQWKTLSLPSYMGL